MHVRKSLHCLEEVVGRNMDDKGNFVRSEIKEGSSKESYHIRECIYHYEENLGSNMNIEGASVEVLDGNGEHVIGNHGTLTNTDLLAQTVGAR